jgi:hypothetical protein
MIFENWMLLRSFHQFLSGKFLTEKDHAWIALEVVMKSKVPQADLESESVCGDGHGHKQFLVDPQHRGL